LRITFTPPVVRVADERTFERLTKALFSQRRKTLANALKQFHQKGADALATSGFDGRRRPETLSPAELGRLSDLLTAADRPPVL
jgi:16S rRNA (adenine1518-N6/adenine1519-N6)-dimethyltransferase